MIILLQFHSCETWEVLIRLLNLYLLCIPVFSFTQEYGWSLQLSQITGKLIKHSDKFNYDPQGLVQLAELDFSYHTRGNSDWQHHYNLPRMGIGFRYIDPGKPEDILGKGYSFFPFIDFTLSQFQKSSIRFMLGCGLAYLDKIYHLKYNSDQTAIGSHWNNLTTFQFRYELKIKSQHHVLAGLSLTHISNGAYQAPNLGLNFVCATLGYSFHFYPATHWKDKSGLTDPGSSEELKKSNEDKTAESKISAALEYGVTLKESEIPGGPKFFIRWLAIDAAYQYNAYKSWRLGVELEENALDVYRDKTDNGNRINVYLAHQWLFGNIGLTFRSGYEFKRKNQDVYPIATKLDLCYIMPFQLVHNIRPYLGVSLKAHLDTAEYIGILSGLRFYKLKS